MSEPHDAARLQALLRRESENLPLGMAPVAEAMAQGRRIRRRRRHAVAASAVAVILAAVSLPVGVGLLRAGEPSPPAAGPVSGEGAEIAVEPYQVVEVGHGAAVALRPPAWPGAEAGRSYSLFDAAESAEALAVLESVSPTRVPGDNRARPDLSVYVTRTASGVILSGTWSTPSLPPAITVRTAAGTTVAADVLRPKGFGGWGIWVAVLEDASFLDMDPEDTVVSMTPENENPGRDPERIDLSHAKNHPLIASTVDASDE